MKGSLKSGSVAFLVAAAAVALTGCAENESTLFIRGCLVPDAETCVADPSGQGSLNPRGFLDLAVSPAGSYSCPLLIGNQLVPVGDDVTLRTETSRIFVYAFDVDITETGTAASVGSFRASANGMIDPTSGPSPGYGAVNALLVDSAIASANAGKELSISVVALGRTLGGTEIESGAWPFQVAVCSGCTCSGQNPICQFPDESVKPDCLRGVDGHCSFVETDCP